MAGFPPVQFCNSPINLWLGDDTNGTQSLQMALDWNGLWRGGEAKIANEKVKRKRRKWPQVADFLW
jgi:hypothetical protein